MNIYRNGFKRLLDFVLSLLALILLSPALLIVALLVRIKLGSPVLFRQERPGKDETIFTMYKFRTMTDEKDGQGELLPDEVRLTSFGQFLRKTSLDELPELLNILKGDMSVVGPRPLLVGYLPLYNEEQRKRHGVRPGLTGWAQVNGRNAISWKQKFEYDVWYAEHLGFALDVRIFFLTIGKVFSRSGISQEGQATMEAFTGNTGNDEETNS